jgi:hypothetical protein
MSKNISNIIIISILVISAIYFFTNMFKQSSSSQTPQTPQTLSPSLNKVKIAKNCNLEYNVEVGVGQYNRDQLNNLDGFHKEISSFEIPPSSRLKVILYEGDNFEGPSAEFVSSVPCLNNHPSNFNDRAGSMKIVLI